MPTELIPDTIFRLVVTVGDIECAECRSRRRCPIALAVNRQLALGGDGNVKVDANELRFTLEQRRCTCRMTRGALAYLRGWDELSTRIGLEAARAQYKPAYFKLPVIEVRPLSIRVARVTRPPGLRPRRSRGRRYVQEVKLRYIGV
jgi:hypothetical protein